MHNTLIINNKSSEKDINTLLFCCCFSYIIREEDFEEDPQYPYNDFEELCIVHGIKKHSRLLYMYCIGALNKMNSVRSTRKEKRDSLFRHDEITLTEALYTFLNKNNSQKTIIIKDDGVESGRITNEEVINAIANGLLNKYKEKKYDKLIKYGIVQYIVSKNLDKKWIEYYCAKNKISKVVYQTQLNEDPSFPVRTIQELDEYIIFFRGKDIDSDFLKIKLKALKANPRDSSKKKSGAPPKNDLMADIAEKISYIIGFQDFLSQDKHTAIKEMPIKNVECRVIHDCLNFFGMIENKKDTTFYTTSNTAYSNYIRTTINNHRKKRKLEDITEDALNKIYSTMRNSNKSLIFRYVEGEDMRQLMYKDFLIEADS